ncbi:OmpP1/FadL family transporter [Crenobacter caeni]|uniref:Transporter n=1 Tax=Crenobacter caeni TaxID=2705474 RepID=A0A6B2KRM3_9NEIS|nr:outer membrane protein transport protein [Crenobacter caeni]NDV12895.1 hypothetical protein [Crenobacter caeni]
MRPVFPFVSVLSLSLLSAAAQAAGFQLSEQSVVGLGRAHAGAGVAGDDLSSVFYNPAGMVLVEGEALQFGATYAELDAPFAGQNTTYWPVAQGGPQTQAGADNGRAPGELVPSFFYVRRLDERLVAGLGLTVPFGLGARYGDNWFGRDHGISSSIKTLDINPSLAYRVNERWSIGGGVSAQYADAKLKQGGFDPVHGEAYGQLKADSWGFGYNAGVLYQPDAERRVGLSFRSKVRHKAEGDYTNAGFSGGFAGLNGRYPGHAVVTTPETLLLSGWQRVSPQWALSGSLRWSNWSRFDTLSVHGSPTDHIYGNGPTLIRNHWRDSWFASLGADYAYSDKLTLRGGVAYETTPVPDDAHRNALIPDTDRIWLSLGASYRVSRALSLDAGYTYLRGVGSRGIDHVVTSPKPNSTVSRLTGEYGRLSGHLFGLQLQYRL